MLTNQTSLFHVSERAPDPRPPEPQTGSAVGGTSLLTATRRVVTGTGEVPPLRLTGFSELIDAILLHEHVLLVGKLTSADELFLEELNTTLGTRVVQVSTLEDLSDQLSLSAIEKQLARILQNVFGESAPPLTAGQINERPEGTRVVGDYQRETLSSLVSCFEWRDSGVRADYAQLERNLLQLLTASHTDQDAKFVANHLYRSFLYSALASLLNGSASLSGMRRFVMALQFHEMGGRTPITLSKRFYDIAQLAFSAATRTVLFEADQSLAVTLGVAYLAIKARKREDLLVALRDAREELAGYRARLRADQDIITSPHTPLKERVQRHSFLVGAGATYLSEIVREFNLHYVSEFSWFEKMWAASLQNVTGTVSAEVSAAESTLGIGVGALLKSAKQATEAQRSESEVRELVNIAAQVANQRDLVANVSNMLPIPTGDRHFLSIYNGCMGATEISVRR